MGGGGRALVGSGIGGPGSTPSAAMPTHAEVIAQNPLEAPAPFWDNVYYGFNGLAAFLIVASALGTFVFCCVLLIVRVERWEDRLVSGSSSEAKLRDGVVVDETSNDT